MKNIYFSKHTALLGFLAILLFAGCNEKAITKSNENIKVKESTSVDKEEAPILYTKYDSIVHETFKDSAKIGPNDKLMIVIFGTNTDPYTDRLKADIQNSTELGSKIKNDFSSYYLKAHENLRHKLFHEGEYMDVDTKTMISIYGIDSTPTIIFADKKGKAVLMVPGYMPPEQFIETIKFMQSNKWENKDRKNGEVYEALKQHYIDNGIDVIQQKEK
jgi:thioredoxin-related protein